MSDPTSQTTPLQVIHSSVIEKKKEGFVLRYFAEPCKEFLDIITATEQLIRNMVGHDVIIKITPEEVDTSASQMAEELRNRGHLVEVHESGCTYSPETLACMCVDKRKSQRHGDIALPGGLVLTETHPLFQKRFQEEIDSIDKHAKQIDSIAFHVGVDGAKGCAGVGIAKEQGVDIQNAMDVYDIHARARERLDKLGLIASTSSISAYLTDNIRVVRTLNLDKEDDKAEFLRDQKRYTI